MFFKSFRKAWCSILHSTYFCRLGNEIDRVKRDDASRLQEELLQLCYAVGKFGDGVTSPQIVQIELRIGSARMCQVQINHSICQRRFEVFFTILLLVI